jgi:phosphoribosylanthranilate isomerase
MNANESKLNEFLIRVHSREFADLLLSSPCLRVSVLNSLLDILVTRMPRTRIKICGVRRPQDALAAADAGVDAIGLVFYPRARRRIDLDTARQILGALPAFVTPVGLFVDQDAESIRQIAADLHLGHIQLHGHEEPTHVASLRPFAVLKAIKTSRDTLRAELDFWRESIQSLDLRNLKAFVLETPTGAADAPGGTGQENDWDAIVDAQLAGAFEGLPPIIAAGGLNPQNVAEVVRRIRPYAVDVSSGVEEVFGEKSVVKIGAFVEAVAGASDACGGTS